MPAGYIDPPTRQRLEETGAAAREAVAARDQAIYEAVEAGISLRTVAECVGVNHETCRNIAGRLRDIEAGRKPRKGGYPRGPDEPLFP